MKVMHRSSKVPNQSFGCGIEGLGLHPWLPARSVGNPLWIWSGTPDKQWGLKLSM